MRHPALKPLLTGPLPVLILLGSLMLALHLTTSAVQNAAELNRMFLPLLVFVVGGLIALSFVVLGNILGLLGRFVRRETGARLTLRIVAMFSFMAVAPVAIVYAYSQQFLLHGIDSWFNVRIDQAMEDALALSRASLDLHKRERLKTTHRLLHEMEGTSVAAMSLSLDGLRERYGALELSLMDMAGVVLTSSNLDPTVLVPDRTENSIVQQVREGADFVAIAPRGPTELQIRVVIADPGRSVLLQALFPSSANVAGLTEKVQNAYASYKELAYLRESLKGTFTLALALVVVFSLLGAVWAAFFTSRRLVAPVVDIAEGSKLVGEGEYGQQITPPRSRDELRFLVDSFNTMSRRIAQARDEAERNRRQVESQRTYLETVLGRLSSGVMTIDPDGHLRTANQAACDILRVPCQDHLGQHLRDLSAQTQHLQPLVDTLTPILVPTPTGDAPEWRGEVQLYGHEGRQVLLCRFTPLAHTEDASAGYVLVFDDVTTLIRAQRDAAWGEVARRLAHEIKNPLTPIQLSAERLRRKYMGRLPEGENEVLDRATHTIVQQVEAMKAMVNAFSDYARPPKMNPEPLVLDRLVQDVLELYLHNHGHIELQLEAGPARVEADPVRLRQVVHNLIKNALEAVEGHEDGRISVLTSLREDHGLHQVELRIEDNGPGIPAEMLDRLFEPYVTTKIKGTGLGLAIVQKIAEEHGGSVRAENLPAGGAAAVLKLPRMSAEG